MKVGEEDFMAKNVTEMLDEIQGIIERTSPDKLLYESTVIHIREVVGIHQKPADITKLMAFAASAKFTGDWKAVEAFLMQMLQEERDAKLEELKNLFESIKADYGGFNGVLLIDEDVHWASEGDSYGEELHKKAKEFHRDCLRLKSQANQEAYISKPSKLGL